MKHICYLGVSREDITPSIGTCLYGYRPNLHSESIRDRLHVTTFYLKQDDTQSLMISATVCSVQTNLVNRLRKEISGRFSVPYENILLSATHTHTGPNLTGDIGWGEVDMEYYESIFRPAVLKSVENALKNPVPVSCGFATGLCKAGINRRELTTENLVALGQNPWGVYNPEMTVISFRDESGKPIANMVHYGCHGTVAGASTAISRDWSGVMTDALEEESGAITAFFNGPEGDVGPRISNGRTAANPDYIPEVGEIAAESALCIYKNITDFSVPKLSAKEGMLSLPLLSKLSMDKVMEGLEKFPDPDAVNWEGKMHHYYKAVKAAIEAGEEDKACAKISQTILRIGDVIFAAFPYELFSEIGMRIDCAVKDFKVLSLSNTNGSEGYFPTEDQLCRGGYEIIMFRYNNVQCFTDDADYRLIKETLRNLEDIVQ
ncbi:MAG: neutral/alkaline non-lysosomal ceramidase N-terminal domain-containing protein [Clostridia bacterium]|nr:neutral/alkaline non-lysosomal ceramidase N-terminal domain-containing protein [Clostridia bacterium]